MQDAADKDAEFRRRWREINSDTTLSDKEKASRQQELQRLRSAAPNAAVSPQAACGRAPAPAATAAQAILDETLKCTICLNTCDKPVTAPCQHNFCLECFNDWVKRHNSTCPTCRAVLPKAMCSNPRINAALVSAIRLAMRGEKPPSAAAVAARIANDQRPDEAFTTERAVRAGKANAASGRIFVTIPLDHFGPITAEFDPVKNQGVRVGDSWSDRLECRQWGAHFPHVAGIAGQSSQGAQSVALSGGYEDDEDHGEWFLYTGSGGRDLSGNKRTCKKQSHDQVFDKMNLALKISCIKGLPVRVVRSHKEKRSSFAPSQPSVRYDGIYRIEKCWRAKGKQEHLMCRYLFVRCDNEPAPWTAAEHGDRPRPVPEVKEITPGMEVFLCKGQKWWDYDPATKRWGWTRPPPDTQKHGNKGEPTEKRKKRMITLQQRLLKEFGCKLCGQVLRMPLTMLCAHSFCKECIEAKFVGVGDARDRAAPSGRSMREVKVVKPCPVCKVDIADCLRSASVNTGMAETIIKLKRAVAAHGEDGSADSAEEADSDAGLLETEGAHGVVEAPPSAAPKPSAAELAAQAKAKAVEALYTEFAEYDRDLIDGMLEDQGGDIPEVHAALRRMRNQAKLAKRKADAGSGEPGKRAKRGAGEAS